MPSTWPSHDATILETRLRRGDEERLVTVERWNSARTPHWVRTYSSLAAKPTNMPMNTIEFETSAEATQVHRDLVEDFIARGFERVAEILG